MEEADQPLFSAMMAVTSGLELSTTLERIVRSAMNLVDARYGVLGVLGAGGDLDQFIQVGFDDELVERIGQLPTGAGLLGQLVEHPHALRLKDLKDHPASVGFPAGHPPMHSFLGVPVRVRDVVFGNIYLTEKSGGQAFTEDDELNVGTLAAMAGVAIENARLFEQMRTRERWQRAVTEMANASLSGADAGEVLEIVANRARYLAEADVVVVCLPDSQGNLRVEIVSLADHEPEPLHPLFGSLVPDDCVVAQTFRTGLAMSADHLSIEGAADITGPVIAIPLRTPERVLGTIALVSARAIAPFTPAALEQAEAFAAQAAVTLVLAESRSERERLAVFEDRDRIGRDLHDLVIQRLFAIGMQLEGTRRTEGMPASAAVRIDQAVDDLDATVKEIRQTIFALHEGAESGLLRGLRSRVLAEVSAATTMLGFLPSLQFAGTVDSLVDDDIADQLVAALRESLSNVARHARASQVLVAVVVADANVVLTVIDNGVGMPEGGRRSGLLNLGARAEEFGGSFVIEPRPSGGTQLTWRVPLR